MLSFLTCLSFARIAVLKTKSLFTTHFGSIVWELDRLAPVSLLSRGASETARALLTAHVWVITHRGGGGGVRDLMTLKGDERRNIFDY
jgi:hypothetical protein